MKKKIFCPSNIFVLVIVLFLYIPIFSLVVFSFNATRSLNIWSGISFQWYVKLFTDQTLISVVSTTLIVAILSTFISAIIGTLAAISISKRRKMFKEILLQASNIPIINPEIVTAISLFLLFGAFMIPRGYATLLIAHITFSIPYVIATVYPKLCSLDNNLLDAAYDLGASPIKALIKVILPQLKGAIAAGAAIAFTMSFDDFVISYFTVNGTAIKNISVYLYTLKRGVDPSINALSTIVIMAVGVIVALSQRKNKTRRV